MEESLRSRSLRERRKREQRKRIFLLCLILLAVAVLLAVVLLFKSCNGNKNKNENTPNKEPIVGQDNESDSNLEDTGVFFSGIYIEDIAMEGLTKTEGKKLVLKKLEESCPWDMQVKYEEKVYEIPDILSSNLDEIMDQAYKLGRDGDEKQQKEAQKQLKENPVYLTVEGEYDETIVEHIIEEIDQEFSVEATSADLIGYDKEKKEFLYSNASEGLVLDKEDLKEKIDQAVKEKKYDAILEAKMNEMEAGATSIKDQVKKIGTFKTTTTSNKDRNENIRLACEAMNGIVVKPGETFSMNELTGARTVDKGYKPAGTIVNGKLVEEPGGGVCQVSSTLYNALIFAGLKTTERFSHSLEPSYVTPGEDAMVSYPSADLKFVNNGTSSVIILFNFQNQQLEASVYGVPILEEGTTREMYSERAEVIPIPEPEYIEDSSLKAGEEVVVTAGKQGVKVVTYLITKKDGVEISREFFHNSIYKAKTPVIRRNKNAKETASPKPTQTPKPTDDATLNENDILHNGEKPLVTLAPEQTKKPAVTKEPVETEEPKATKEPVETEEPKATEEPVQEPQETQAPQETQKPIQEPEESNESGESGETDDSDTTEEGVESIGA